MKILLILLTTALGVTTLTYVVVRNQSGVTNPATVLQQNLESNTGITTDLTGNFPNGIEVGKDTLLTVDDKGNLSTDGAILAGDLRVSGETHLSSLSLSSPLYVSGVKIIDENGKIPGLTVDYIADLDGSALTGVNADHLDGIDSGSFLRADQTDTMEGALNFTAQPGSPNVGGGPVYINPAASTAGYTLFGVAVNNTSKFRVDAEGDTYIAGNLSISGTLTGSTSLATSLSQGSIVFVGSSGNLSQDNSNLYWDDTNNRLGIGASSPATTLDVGGDITILSGSDIRPSSDSTTAINIADFSGADFVTFDTTNQRVGVGTTSPQSALHLYRASGGSIMKISSSSSNAPNIFDITTESGTPYASNKFHIQGDFSGALTKLISYTDGGTGLVFNEDGQKMNTRFETDNEINALFLNRYSDTIGIGAGANGKLSRFTIKGKASFTATGTTTANATTTIAGSGTVFTDEVGIGDRIALSSAPSTYATVLTIPLDASLTVDTPLGDGTSQTITVLKSHFRIDDSSNNTKLILNDQGYLGIGDTTPTEALTVATTGIVGYAGSFFNDGNLDTHQGVFIQGCLDVNPTAACNLLELRDGDGTVLGAIEGNGAGGVTTAATGSDYAELFNGDRSSVGKGDILSLDTNGKVIPSLSSDKVIGVYSTTPATLGNWKDKWESDNTLVPVGLLGQLSVNVTTENGDIHMGDPITVSPTSPGKGTKAISSQRILGFSLEDTTPDNTIQGNPETHQIKVYVSPTWYQGDVLSFQTTNNGDKNNVSLPDNLTTDTSLTDQVNQTLQTNKLTTLGDTLVTGTLAIGTLTLREDSINTLTTLNIQPLSLSDISFLGGKVKMNKDGDIVATFNGGIQLNTEGKERPECNEGSRGTVWLTQGQDGQKDVWEGCSKDASGAYSWGPLN